MKRFILNSSLFLLLILCLLVGLEYLARAVPNEYKFKAELMDRYAQSIELLILGSSHADNGINPGLFPMKTFNLALQGQVYKYDLFLLKKYIDQMPELRYIILPLSYRSLFTNASEGEWWWREICYRLYMECDYYPALSRCGFEICNLPRASTLCTTYYIKGKNDLHCDSLGMNTTCTVERKSPRWDQGAANARKETPNQLYSETLTQNQIELNEIAAIAQEHRVKLLLVTMPVYKSFSDAADKEQLKVMQQTADEVCLRYKNVSYLNLFDMQGLLEDDFYDATHLTIPGAEKVTTILRDYLNCSIVSDSMQLQAL